MSVVPLHRDRAATIGGSDVAATDTDTDTKRRLVVMTPYLPETTIRYTTGNLGLIDSRETVPEGALGRVLGPAPDGSGWLYTEPARFPGKVCPVDPSMIARA